MRLAAGNILDMMKIDQSGAKDVLILACLVHTSDRNSGKATMLAARIEPVSTANLVVRGGG